MGKSDSALQDDIRTDSGVMPTVTIFMPITRAWRVAKVAEMLAKLDTEGYVCDLLICIDSTEITEHYVSNALEKWEIPYKYKIIHTGKRPAVETNIATRRDRIVEMLEFSTKHIGDTDFVFMVEDDSQIEPNAMRDLLTNFAHIETAGVKVGLIEGVQVGRHGYRMIGGWRTDDLENPTVMQTIPFNRNFLLEKIDGGGLYCMITPTHLFKAHKWYWHDNCFSVDVTYGLELRKKGYQNFIDWSVEAGHVQQDGATLYPNESCVVVRYEKEPEGHWNIKNKGKKGYVS